MPPLTPAKETDTAQKQSVPTVNVLTFPDLRNGGKFTQNSSHLITKLLPSEIKTSRKRRSPGKGADGSTNGNADDGAEPDTDTDEPIQINILNPTAQPGSEVSQGVPVEYAKVRSYIAELYSSHVSPASAAPTSSDVKTPVDIFLHLGMANGWSSISIERCAYKEGFSSSWWGNIDAKSDYYMLPDNVGQTATDAGPSPWDAVPMGLGTEFDVDELVGDAMFRLDRLCALEADGTGGKEKRRKIPVKPHAEPGSYCCGFMFYESLANCWVRGRRRDVLFVHVPGWTDKESLGAGRDAVVAVVEGAVGQFLDRGEGGGQLGGLKAIELRRFGIANAWIGTRGS